MFRNDDGNGMKIPDKLRIQGIEYTVFRPEVLIDGGRTCFGTYTYGTASIGLAQTLGNGVEVEHQQACVTMIHEVLHAFTKHSYISLDDDEQKEDNKIDILAHCMYQFLQDNGRRLFDIVEDDHGDTTTS